MKPRKRWISIVLYFIVLANGPLSGQEQHSWTMEFRVAANPDRDKFIADLAQSEEDREIYKEGKLIGKWVDVIESIEAELLADANLISRRNLVNKLALLVLISPNDVTQNDVSEIAEDKGRWGELVLRVYFTEEGSSKIFKQTKELLVYPESSRYIAQMMDGKVYSVPMVQAPVRTTAVICGDLTKEMIDDIERRSKAKRVYFEPPPGAITITPLRLIAFVCILLVVIFGALPAKKLQRSKYPHLWTISGSIVGMLVGAYTLGVSKTIGIESTVAETWEAVVGETVVINLTKVFIGGIIGIGCGFLLGRLFRFFMRRAVYNIVKAIVKMVR